MSRKSVGITTFHYTVNYGGVLQCYALYKTLQALGYEPFIVDYRPDQVAVTRRSIGRRALGRAALAVNRALGLKRREMLSEAFSGVHMPQKSRPYLSYSQLVKDPPSAFAYTVGSDQVWNPDLTNLDRGYFLDFGDEGVKRISYSASIGKKQLTPPELSVLADRVKNLDSISVREISAMDLIEEVTSQSVDVVLDPTLLIDEQHWRGISAKLERKAYLLLYVLPGNKAVENNLRMISEKICNEQSLDLVIIGDREYRRIFHGKHGIYGAGPSEFLSYISNASVVVTNSFHGTAFSTNLRIPFISVVPSSKAHGIDRSSRLRDFLTQLGLDDRIWDAGTSASDLSVASILDTRDLEAAEARLREQRKDSIDWLKKAIES